MLFSVYGLELQYVYMYLCVFAFCVVYVRMCICVLSNQQQNCSSTHSQGTMATIYLKIYGMTN